MGQYLNGNACVRVREKLIRSDCLHSLVQAPTWSRAWRLLRILSSWVLKISQDGNWTSFPGPSSNFTQCSGWFCLQLEFLCCSLGVLPLMLSLCSSGKALPLSVLPFPSSKEFNKTNLLGCLLVCFPLSASLVSVFSEWLTAEPCLCIWALSKKDLVSV